MNKEAEEVIISAIKEMIEEPYRDFSEDPLTQEELLAIATQLYSEIGDPKTDEKLAQFYISCLEYLKTKILIQ